MYSPRGVRNPRNLLDYKLFPFHTRSPRLSKLVPLYVKPTMQDAAVSTCISYHPVSRPSLAPSRFTKASLFSAQTRNGIIILHISETRCAVLVSNPLRVVCRLLGVPVLDTRRFYQSSHVNSFRNFRLSPACTRDSPHVISCNRSCAFSSIQNPLHVVQLVIDCWLPKNSFSKDSDPEQHRSAIDLQPTGA